MKRYRRTRVIAGKGSAADQFADALRGIAVGADDRLYAVGDQAVKVFSADGELQYAWETAAPGFSIAVAPDGTVYVGQAGQVELFDANGKPLSTWRDAEHLGLVSEIGFVGNDVFVADSKDRCIRRFDKNGKYLADIGNDNRMKGFLLPNRHLDFCIDGKGVIHAANPGKHRIERYAVSGELLGSFGRFGGANDPAGFGGCCNPTNLALMSDGQVVVTEKADPRAKIYTGDGKLLTVFGESEFDLTCKNMDVAVDSHGRIHIIDTARLQICTYAIDGDPSATGADQSTGREADKP